MNNIIVFICVFYYIFSVLFMVGYADTKNLQWWEVGAIVLLNAIIAPIIVPINIGYYIRKNSK